jgi:chaperonin GroES
MDDMTDQPVSDAPDVTAPSQEPPRPTPAQMMEAIIAAPNIADILEPEQLATIGEDVCREHAIDYESMKDWRTRMERGIELASLVKTEKSYPFEKAANVKYPLITTAALQFNARAYPAIVPPDDMVKCKVFGQDAQGLKQARGLRVAAHMSYQLGTEIEEWEETTDQMLVILPIVGTVVRKTWFDPAAGRPRVKLIDPGAFVMNSKCRTLESAPRVGEVLSLFPTEITERRATGQFRDVDFVEVEGEDKDAAQEFIEQHRRLDLDGDDYPEPYIVTVHKKTRTVARIVADFEQSDVMLGPDVVVSIKRGSYFTPFHFLPSIDGGFFGTGLGFLLGDISESINTIINMMMDAGHMASRGGGFLGSEFRIKGGAQQFRPGEWKMVQARGADVKNSIVPMTFPGPDATLFQLLGLLIEAGREVASVKDIMTGDTGGKAQTATTTLALIEQGMMVFTAAYKRIFRSLKREFKLLAKINAQTLDPQQYSAFHDPSGQTVVSPQQDYAMADMDIQPVADPRSVTKMQEVAKAEIVMQLAKDGKVDPGEATKRILHAAGIPDVDALAPKPNPMQQEMEKMQMQAAQADLTLKMVEVDQAIADLEKTRSESMKNMTDAAANVAEQRLVDAIGALGMIRDAIGRTLGRGAGGMAGAPGFNPGAGFAGGQPQGPAGGGGPVLLGGPAMAGGGQVVPLAAGGLG